MESDHDIHLHNWSRNCGYICTYNFVDRPTADWLEWLDCNWVMDTNVMNDYSEMISIENGLKWSFEMLLCRSFRWNWRNFHLDETVGDQMLEFLFDTLIRHQSHDSDVINYYAALWSWTWNGLGITIIRNLDRQILTPAILAVFMTTAQTYSFLLWWVERQQKSAQYKCCVCKLQCHHVNNGVCCAVKLTCCGNSKKQIAHSTFFRKDFLTGRFFPNGSVTCALAKNCCRFSSVSRSKSSCLSHFVWLNRIRIVVAGNYKYSNKEPKIRDPF